MTPEESATFGLLWLAGVCVLYVVPAIVAFRRGHPNRWAILAVNVFLGATGIGWAGALVWSLHAMHRAPGAAGSHGGESGLNMFANDVSRVRVESGGAPAGSGAPPLTTTAAEIERLGRLRAAGHLSESEYATLMGQVLARIWMMYVGLKPPVRFGAALWGSGQSLARAFSVEVIASSAWENTAWERDRAFSVI